MNKKFKLLIIFVLAFIILSNNVLAEKDCPNTFYYQEWHTPSGVTQVGCWNDDKKDDCKKKGGTIVPVGSTGSTIEKCFIKKQNEIKVTFDDNSGGGGRVKSKTCTTSNKKCEINFSDLIDTSSDINYIGYSEKSDCSNTVNSKIIKVDSDKRIYLCYSDMLAECTYSDDENNSYTLTYGKKEVKTGDSGDIRDFTAQSLYAIYYRAGMICPNSIYLSHIDGGTFLGDNEMNVYHIEGCEGCKELSLTSKKDFLAQKKEISDDTDENCTIITSELKGFIDEILKWVRLIVPILLTIYGTLDFAKSVYAKEDEMKKNKDRFIKRLLAAILVFLTPMFVNLILRIANMAWSWINPDICIK